jgi:hypothetical protein
LKKAKRNSLIGLTILTGLIVWSGSGSAAECNSAYAADSGTSCTFTPDTMRIQLYRFGLCETEPSIGDDTSCQFFVDSTTPTEVDLSDGGAFSLPSSGSLSTGTYPFVLLLWDTTFSFFHQFPEFDTALTGANGVTGRFCYSNGNIETISSLPSTSRGISCATTAEAATAAQAFTQYDLQVFSNDLATTLSGSLLSGGTFDAQLLDSDFTGATAASATDSSIPGTTLTYPTSDAQFLRVVITLTEPVDITASTTSVDIGVDLTNGFQLNGGFFNVLAGSGLCSGDTATSCLDSSSFSNIGFRFTAD